MTWQSAICFSGLLCLLSNALPRAGAATLSGRVASASAGDSGRKKNVLSDIVVWLEPAAGSDTHLTTGRHARILQKDKRFTPHILVISTGTTVDFPNLDPIFHNAFSNFDGQIFDLGLYAPGTSRGVQFNRAGIVRIFCNIHPSMSAVIVVVPSDNFTTAASDGSFVLSEVASGDYHIHFFDERATPETLQLLTKSISVDRPQVVLPPITISEATYLPAAHKNKYGRDYPANNDDTTGGYTWPVK